MSQPQWTAVDDYLSHLFAPEDEALQAALHDSAAAGLPAIHVAANQGKLLAILAQSIKATRILEIGTLGGYSTIWLARALAPGGKLITLEVNSKHAEVATRNLVRAGLSEVVEVRLGAALDSLKALVAEGQEPFDLVFIDADKATIDVYFEWSLKLAHPGSLIICDNVVRNGAVADADSTDVNVQGVRRMNAMITAESRVTVTAIQTVGSKGYDGLAIALVL